MIYDDALLLLPGAPSWYIGRDRSALAPQTQGFLASLRRAGGGEEGEKQASAALLAAQHRRHTTKSKVQAIVSSIDMKVTTRGRVFPLSRGVCFLLVGRRRREASHTS